MPSWTFLTTHGLVLSYMAKHPRSTVREIASAINITERTAHKVISDLETGGYVERQRIGRNNVYRINAHLALRHETNRRVLVADLLRALGWGRHPRASERARAKVGLHIGAANAESTATEK